MMDDKTIILNQGIQGNCKGYSFLAGIINMRNIDYLPIVEELKKSNNLLTNQKASNWFIEKGYIEGIDILKSFQIKIMLRKGIPVIAGIANATWNNSPPYIITFGKDIGSHSICIVGFMNGLYKIQNSWGESWGDKGYCYLKEEDIKKLIAPCRIILKNPPK